MSCLWTAKKRNSPKQSSSRHSIVSASGGQLPWFSSSIPLDLLADPTKSQIAVTVVSTKDLPLPHVCEQGLHAVHSATLQTTADFHDLSVL